MDQTHRRRSSSRDLTDSLPQESLVWILQQLVPLVPVIMLSANRYKIGSSRSRYNSCRTQRFEVLFEDFAYAKTYLRYHLRELLLFSIKLYQFMDNTLYTNKNSETLFTEDIQTTVKHQYKILLFKDNLFPIYTFLNVQKYFF